VCVREGKKMRRGGSTVNSPRKKKIDPVMLAAVFGIGGFIFLILAIVVPIVMSERLVLAECGSVETIHRGEQLICKPKSKETVVAKAELKAAHLIKNYRVKRGDSFPVEHRRFTYLREHNLHKGHAAFPVTCINQLFFDMNASCTGESCETVKMYWLIKEKYDSALSKDSFDESKFTPKIEGFVDPQRYDDSLDLTSTYYIVFSNSNKDTTISFAINIDYSVYNLDGVKSYHLDSDGLCKFKNVDTNDAIIMDYADPDYDGPETIDAEVGIDVSSKSVMIFMIIFFVVLTVGCFTMAVLLILVIFGKIGKKKRKSSKRSSKKVRKGKGRKGSYDTPEAAAEKAVLTSKGADEVPGH